MAAHATDYHVNPAGDDGGAGTAGDPLLTIQEGADRASAGDVVVIHAGSYHERVETATGGSSGSPITFRGAGDGEAIVDGTGVTVASNDALFLVRDASYVVLEDLTLRDSTGHCLAAVRTERITFDTLVVDECVSSGIFIADSTDVAHTSVMHSTVSNAGEGGIVLWQNADGYFRIERNTVHHVAGGSNFDGIQGNDSPYSVVRQNTVYAMGGSGDYIDFGGDQDSPTSDNHHIVIDQNLIYVADGGAAEDLKLNNRPTWSIIRRNSLQGRGMTFYEQPHTTVAVYNNTIVDAATHALQLWNQDKAGTFSGITLRNNAFIGSTGLLIQHAPEAREGSPPDIVMDGNAYRFTGGGIDWVDGGSSYSLSGSSADYATWRAGTGQEVSGGLYLTTSDLFVNTDCHDYTPTAGSALVDAGTALTTTTGSGTSATVPVAENFFFFDGYGLVEGDTVVVGSNDPALVLEVDEANDEIDLDRSITFTAGQPVNLLYAGSAPDIGAVERR